MTNFTRLVKVAAYWKGDTLSKLGGENWGQAQVSNYLGQRQVSDSLGTYLEDYAQGALKDMIGAILINPPDDYKNQITIYVKTAHNEHKETR